MSDEKNNEVTSRLDDCPYIIGLQCNQKELLCDKNQFDARCVMMAFRQIDGAIEAKNEYLINEGILRACHVLVHKDFIKKKYDELSPNGLKDEVMKILEAAKKEGLEWHDVGWEWARQKKKKDGG